ncbi:helix-turn-helix domain-containing protein [Devosia rhodophyticola]|uniref:Helix-turn-helix domain-containing protein n=1 Tax=Devosia rhodophyticola TaxID=3026423 RepID=A0ABY7YYV7_9HYPH|nr:helix-turn-helix domain-containing protein [Devosia rhodophyticola]WDR06424.1 helix-turn-helix domain-containing protein [Devosia rhodophyticola]
MLTHPSRCRRNTAQARQLAMYLIHVSLGRSLTEVGRVFGRDRTTVSYACALIEDGRDDARFDAAVDQLERQIEASLLQGDEGTGHGAG